RLSVCNQHEYFSEVALAAGVSLAGQPEKEVHKNRYKPFGIMGGDVFQHPGSPESDGSVLLIVAEHMPPCSRNGFVGCQYCQIRHAHFYFLGNELIKKGRFVHICWMKSQ